MYRRIAPHFVTSREDVKSKKTSVLTKYILLS